MWLRTCTHIRIFVMAGFGTVRVAGHRRRRQIRSGTAHFTTHRTKTDQVPNPTYACLRKMMTAEAGRPLMCKGMEGGDRNRSLRSNGPARVLERADFDK